MSARKNPEDRLTLVERQLRHRQRQAEEGVRRVEFWFPADVYDELQWVRDRTSTSRVLKLFKWVLTQERKSILEEAARAAGEVEAPAGAEPVSPATP